MMMQMQQQQLQMQQESNRFLQALMVAVLGDRTPDLNAILAGNENDNVNDNGNNNDNN